MSEHRLGYDLDTVWVSNREQLRRLLRGLTRDADLTEDLLQEAYVRAFKGFDGYLGGDIGAWLRKISVNVFYNHARKRSYSQESALEDVEVPAEPSLDPASWMSLELFDVRKALSALPPTLRDCLLLRHYLGLTSEQIAGRMGCSAGTVRWRLSIAIAELRHSLSPSASLSECTCITQTTLLDYLYSTLAPAERADLESHIGTCASCRQSSDQIRCVMLKLDELRSSIKVTEFLEVDADGAITVYLSARFRNASATNLRQATFRANVRSHLMRAVACGKQVSCEHIRDDRFDWDSREVVRRLYSAHLQDPVPPGESLELLTVFRTHSERWAKKLDDGRFRLRWAQIPTLFWGGLNPEPAISYSQAVRLPKDTRLLKFHPLPTEINCDSNTTLIWHTAVPRFSWFQCFVDYRS